MYFGNIEQLLEGARELTVPEDCPFERFYQSAVAMTELIKPYMYKTGASLDEIDRLIGGYGLLGETSNTLSYLMNRLSSTLQTDTPSARTESLQKTFALSVSENTSSQYGHRKETHENVISACNRIIEDVGKWSDAHTHAIEPLDRLKILSHRHQFARALDEIYTFIQGSRVFFETHEIDVEIPQVYKDMVTNYMAETAPAPAP